MAKKQKKKEEGAPAWVQTYGDLMSLLLVFFVLIVSFSKIKKEDMQEIRAEIKEIKKSFGVHGGGGRLPTDTDPKLSFMNLKETVQEEKQEKPKESNTDEPGMQGKESEVTKVREGMQYAIGGRILFEPGSATLTSRGKQRLRTMLAKHEIRGTNNIIELHGHTASLELNKTDPDYRSLWALSYARAQAVYEYLTSDEIGLKRNRFRLVANADREPLRQRAYNTAQQSPNRRVAIIFSEALVEDYTQPESRGGS